MSGAGLEVTDPVGGDLGGSFPRTPGFARIDVRSRIRSALGAERGHRVSGSALSRAPMMRPAGTFNAQLYSGGSRLGVRSRVGRGVTAADSGEGCPNQHLLDIQGRSDDVTHERPMRGTDSRAKTSIVHVTRKEYLIIIAIALG